MKLASQVLCRCTHARYIHNASGKHRCTRSAICMCRGYRPEENLVEAIGILKKYHPEVLVHLRSAKIVWIPIANYIAVYDRVEDSISIVDTALRRSSADLAITLYHECFHRAQNLRGEQVTSFESLLALELDTYYAEIGFTETLLKDNFPIDSLGNHVTWYDSYKNGTLEWQLRRTYGFLYSGVVV